MTKNIGMLVVGVGFVGGQAHAPSFKKIEGSKLVALCDMVEERVKPLAEKHDVKYYLSFDKAIEDPEVDAVVVSVPTPYHYDLAMKAISKGKHVLCEMPVAPKIEQIKELQKAADKAGVFIMPNLNFRFCPVYVKMKELIAEGVIGKPIAMHYREFLPAADLAAQWPAGGWAWNVEKAGGYPDWTLSVWGIDMLRWIMGSEYVDADWMMSYPTFKDFGGIYGYNTMGIAKFENDVVASFHFGASVNKAGAETRFEVYGDNTNVIHGVGVDQIIIYGPDEEKTEMDVKVKGTRVWGHRQGDTHFIESLLANKQPSITLQDAIVAQEIANKITAKLK
ncbi:MAG: Gfo/Idh/MocA family oxidoreductase [Candidatus Bathyarchaeota archaeon]|nr:Gfo/Idh/MocA family oxidoreductase [Candidatus Bathyarchaeota archaeon]